MKLLIIGSNKSQESKLIKKEVIKRNHSVEVVSLSKLIFRGNSNPEILFRKTDIKNFDAVIFRAINQHIDKAKIVARHMKKHKRIIIDELLAKTNYDFNKFAMYKKLKLADIPQPLTFWAPDISGIKKKLKKLELPIMIKDIKGMRGRNVFRFDSKEKIFEFFEKKQPKDYLIQKWHPSKFYWRTVVLGNKVLGAMERLSLKCLNRPKISLEHRSKKAELTPALKKISLAAAIALNMEFIGIDIMPDKNNRLNVLEANRSPQFKRFTQVTGINVAKELIKYIEKKLKLTLAFYLISIFANFLLPT